MDVFQKYEPRDRVVLIGFERGGEVVEQYEDQRYAIRLDNAPHELVVEATEIRPEE